MSGVVDQVVTKAVVALGWIARGLTGLALVAAVAGGIDAALLATISVPAGVVGAVVAAAMAGSLLWYRSRLRGVLEQEAEIRAQLSGLRALGAEGRRTAMDVLPKLQKGSLSSRLRALRDLVGTLREHSLVQRGQALTEALLGPAAALASYAAVGSLVAVAAVPVLAIAALASAAL